VTIRSPSPASNQRAPYATPLSEDASVAAIRLGLASVSADPFLTPADWDEELAGDWAGRLDQRAADDMQVRLRLRVCRLAGLRPGGHAVELGCGTGPLLAGLADAVGPSGTVLGVEPQPVFAERARTRLAGHPAVTVHTGPAQALPLPDASADAVLAQTVLIHLAPATLDAALAEARRVLKPGGRLVSVDQDAGTRVIDHPDRQTTRAIIDYACDHLSADGWLGRRLPRLLRSAGFSVESVEVHPHLATSPHGFMFDGTIRFAQAAVDGGAITPEAGQRWLGQLHELAQAGSFLASVNYYVTAAQLS
jgi:ubiquinone/menaquinone biosynthesis C-methylase UbiE